MARAVDPILVTVATVWVLGVLTRLFPKSKELALRDAEVTVGALAVLPPHPARPIEMSNVPPKPNVRQDIGARNTTGRPLLHEDTRQLGAAFFLGMTSPAA